MRKQKKPRRSSKPPPSPSPLSFLSLPDDIVLNCLARISRTYHPILSLVSKSFPPLLSSPDLQAARSHFEKAEKCLYVCLSLSNNPTWFVLSPTPTKRKLIPVPSLPYRLPTSSAVVSLGSEIYLIGGFVKKKRSRRVFVLDCKSHQWRQAPNMSVSRDIAGVDVIDGKIYVFGRKKDDKEVYNLKTQTWEPTKTSHNQINRYGDNVCIVEVENVSECSRATIYHGELCFDRRPVMGLEELPDLFFVTNPGGRNRVIVWWGTYCTKERETKIWCAQILIHYSSKCLISVYDYYQGHVEWSENVFTYQTCESDYGLFLHSALVTHA